MNGKGRLLRDKMANSGLVHIMAAHSPLSARLAEEAGFDRIWASGFELSALYGLADVSLISMTQHLDMMRAIAEQIELPIVADIDTGFGNAINVIHAIRQYERAGASAVVIEDKSFPKVTSLVADGRQELLRIEEFQGKIEAACRTRKDPDFLVIARDEALIAGLGQDAALKRAAAYGEAAAVTAMKEVFAAILRDGGIQNVHKNIVSVEEIFRLQGMDRIKADEKRFLR